MEMSSDSLSLIVLLGVIFEEDIGTEASESGEKFSEEGFRSFDVIKLELPSLRQWFWQPDRSQGTTPSYQAELLIIKKGVACDEGGATNEAL